MARSEFIKGPISFYLQKVLYVYTPSDLLKESKTVLMGSFFELLGHLFSEEI